MKIRQTGKFCNYCNKNVLASKEQFGGEYTGMLIVGIFTCGITWLLIPFMIIIDILKPWRCQTCGSNLKEE